MYAQKLRRKDGACNHREDFLHSHGQLLTFLARSPSVSQDQEPESVAGDRTVGRQYKSKRLGLHSCFWCEPTCQAALREPSREDPAKQQWGARDSSPG